MSRRVLSLLTLITLAFVSRATLAVDATVVSGVGGMGYSAHVTAGSGRSADDGLARPGFSALPAGQIGVTRAGSGGTTNPGTDDGFHVAGMGRANTGGVGGSTMDTVPGRSVNYVNIVSGLRTAPLVGGRQ